MALSNYLSYVEMFPDKEPEGEWLSPLAVEQLSQLAMPVLSLVGDLDISRARFTAKLFLKEIKQVKQITIKDTAHLPNLEKPDVFNRYMLEFLASV